MKILKKIIFASLLLFICIFCYNCGLFRSEEIEIDLPDLPKGSIKLELIYIKPGTFMMGSNNGDSDEKPVHSVTITEGFYMGKYEVTIGQYAAFLTATGKESGVDWENSSSPLSKKNGKYLLAGHKLSQSWDQPMIEVSWYGAAMFCNYLSEKEGLQPVYSENGDWSANMDANGYRLPTEAEWEYACRAGTQTQFYWGDDSNYTDMDDYAWCGSNSNHQTHIVGQKSPNAWGLFDMSGSVWEWCTDWYDVSYYSNSPNNDPVNMQSNYFRVLRGGGWNFYQKYCCSANRYKDSPEITSNNNGFRIARTP